jgi:hypothetical protein
MPERFAPRIEISNRSGRSGPKREIRRGIAWIYGKPAKINTK